MQRNATIDLQTSLVMAQLQAFGDGALPPAEKQRLLAEVRAQSEETAGRIECLLLESLGKLGLGLREAQANQTKLRGLIEKLTAPPWHPAILLGLEETDMGRAAMVLHGSMRRVVNIGDDVDPELLQIGDEVLLGSELNILMARSPYARFTCGETAQFERYTEDRRLVLKARDEEIVVRPAADLRDVEFRTGDEVRYDGAAWIAYERLERSKGSHLFLEETPQETFADIGGLGRQISELQRALQLHFQHPETVSRYRLQRKRAVLLFGPAGTGKTLLARALANWLAQLSCSGRSRFINVKPAALHSMWYGQTESNYREVFRVAREAGAQEPEVPVVVFFDEVDAIGGARGASVHRIDDRVLNAFMAELNGLQDRGNVLVVAATNRLDTLDPALARPGRLGDLMLRVPRPGRSAARDIFRKHLRSDIPYASNGHDPAATRDLLIESVLSRIYSPNGDGELATLTFRDGKRQPVRAQDMINGAEIAKIAQSATERACLREAENGSGGVALDDLLSGVAEFFETAAQGLTPVNCRTRLDDLPQDMDVVRVDRVERKVGQPHRYLNTLQ